MSERWLSRLTGMVGISGWATVLLLLPPQAWERSADAAGGWAFLAALAMLGICGLGAWVVFGND